MPALNNIEVYARGIYAQVGLSDGGFPGNSLSAVTEDSAHA